ncbi:MAG: hypothetical protein ACK51K_04375 [Gammaproteobacteria bacterium]|jgi:hypothetical protein
MNMSQHHGQLGVTCLRIRAFPHFAFICALSLLAATPAGACSVFGHYVIPTNFELVQMADAIVVATAIDDSVEANDKDPQSRDVRFRVAKVLKGSPPRVFRYPWSRLGQTRPSDPRILDASHPEAHAGMCNRTTFSQRGRYVLFLKQSDDGKWARLGYPFARDSEDYSGDDSLWVTTIKSYVDIQNRLGSMEQFDGLERLMASKMAEKPSLRRDAVIDDIRNHLRSRSPYKPTRYLVDTYEQLERGEPLRYPLRPPSADTEQSFAQAMTDAIVGGGAPDTLSVEAQKSFVLRSLIEGDHPDASPLFERLLAASDVSAERLGAVIRYFGAQGQLKRALDVAETRILPRVIEFDPVDAEALYSDLVLAMRGDGYDEKEEWRSDPEVAERWPRVSFLFARYLGGAMSPGLASNEYADELIGNDFRRSPELTLQSANAHSWRAEEWAIAELSGPISERAASAEDPARLPIRVLVRGLGEERNAAVLKVFCQGGARRMMLIDALGEAADSTYDPQIVERMLSTPELTDAERKALLDALIELDGRSLSRRRFHQEFFGEHRPSDWRILLEAVIKGERFTVEPIVCTPQRP